MLCAAGLISPGVAIELTNRDLPISQYLPTKLERCLNKSLELDYAIQPSLTSPPILSSSFVTFAETAGDGAARGRLLLSGKYRDVQPKFPRTGPGALRSDDPIATISREVAVRLSDHADKHLIYLCGYQVICTHIR